MLPEQIIPNISLNESEIWESCREFEKYLRKIFELFDILRKMKENQTKFCSVIKFDRRL